MGVFVVTMKKKPAKTELKPVTIRHYGGNSHWTGKATKS